MNIAIVVIQKTKVNSSYLPSLSPAQYSITKQNRDLKHQSFHFIYILLWCVKHPMPVVALAPPSPHTHPSPQLPSSCKRYQISRHLIPISPVWNQPCLSKASWVASGSLRYPFMRILPRRHSSPRLMGPSVLPVSRLRTCHQIKKHFGYLRNYFSRQDIKNSKVKVFSQFSDCETVIR